MKKSIQRFIISILGVVFMLIMGTSATAQVYGKNITILPNFEWSADYDNIDARSGDYFSVYARCLGVWPTSGNAVYKIIRCQVTNGYDKVISGVVELNKNNANWTTIPLEDGFAGTGMVGFEFSGHSNKDAYAIVSYDGR